MTDMSGSFSTTLLFSLCESRLGKPTEGVLARRVRSPNRFALTHAEPLRTAHGNAKRTLFRSRSKPVHTLFQASTTSTTARRSKWQREQ